MDGEWGRQGRSKGQRSRLGTAGILREEITMEGQPDAAFSERGMHAWSKQLSIRSKALRDGGIEAYNWGRGDISGSHAASRK